MMTIVEVGVRVRVCGAGNVFLWSGVVWVSGGDNDANSCVSVMRCWNWLWWFMEVKVLFVSYKAILMESIFCDAGGAVLVSYGGDNR